MSGSEVGDYDASFDFVVDLQGQPLEVAVKQLLVLPICVLGLGFRFSSFGFRFSVFGFSFFG